MNIVDSCVHDFLQILSCVLVNLLSVGKFSVIIFVMVFWYNTNLLQTQDQS